MHHNPNETSFRCCYGFLAKDHGAFNYLYRWSVRHMLVEVLAVGLFIYLQFQDKYLSLWAMAAALLSLVGASIPSFCFSNAMGWRLNFAVQILVCIIRVVILVYLIYALATQFSDVELSSIRICLLAVVVLSSCSLTPLFYISYKCKWLLSLRPVEDNFRSNSHNANKAREQLMANREMSSTNPGKSHIAQRADIENAHNEEYYKRNGSNKKIGNIPEGDESAIDSIEPPGSTRSPFYTVRKAFSSNNCSVGSSPNSPSSKHKYVGNARVFDAPEEDEYSVVSNPSYRR